MKLTFKSLLLLVLLGLPVATVTTIASATGACACNSEPPTDPEPEPEPVKPSEKHEAQEVACPAQSDEVAVLKKLGQLAVGNDVAVRDGDRAVIALGGDHEVVKVLSSRRVCVKKVETSTKVAPAAKKQLEERSCDEAAAADALLVCEDQTYTGKYTRKGD